jgi:NADH-quinone oxidoreductase subunit N
LTVGGAEVLSIPPLELAAWRPELTLALTALLALVVGLRTAPVARLLTVAGLALAAGLAWSDLAAAGGAAAAEPWGAHLTVDAVARLVRRALLLAALLVWLAWRPGDARAGGGLALSALGACWLAGAATVTGLLLAVAVMVTGGSLLGWLGAAGATSRNAVGRWHRTASLGFAGLAAALALLAGLAGSLSLEQLLPSLADRPTLPPLTLPLLLALAAVSLALAVLGEPGRFHGGGGEVVPPAVTGWLTAAPALGLAGVLHRVLVGVPPAPPLAGVPDLVALLAGVLVVGGFLAALAQTALVRRLAWAAGAHVGLALLAVTATATGSDPALAPAPGLQAFAAAQVIALVLAGVATTGRVPRLLRAPVAVALALALLSLAAVPPLPGWGARRELLDALLAAGRWPALGLAITGTLMGYAVYLRPLMDLWRFAAGGESAPAAAAVAGSAPAGPAPGGPAAGGSGGSGGSGGDAAAAAPGPRTRG